MKTILTLCLALATLAGSAQVVPIVRNKFTTNNSTASVVINADILDATINSNKLDTATKNLLMGGTNQAYVAADLVVSNAVVSRVNGRGTNATFYLDSGGWFLAEQTTGLHLLGYNNAAWFGDTDAIISEVPYTNTVGIGGNGQYLTALNGQNITSGTISNTQIAAATIGHDKLTIPPLTNNETRVVRFTSLVSAPTNYTDRVEATNSSTLTLYGGGLEAALESGAFKVRSPYYFQGIATGLTQIPGSGITAGSISNAAIADATITSNKLAFAVATPTQVSDVTNATSIRAITAQQTNQAAILALTAQQTNYAALIAMLGPLTNGLGGGAIGGTYQWTNDVNADGNNLYELATIYGSSNSLALTLTGSSAAQDNAISIYRTNSGNGISYFSQIGHEFSGPVSFVDGVGNISAGTLAATGNVTATGTSNYVAALHTDVFSPDELDVDNLYVTNLFTLITNATGLATDANGQLIAGSGGGTTLSNLVETGYVSGFRSNVVVTGNALGTAITPILTLTNGTAAGSGAQQNSPALMLGGAGYNTTGSTSAPVSMGFVTVPMQGTTPTARFYTVYSIGNGPLTYSSYFDSSGAASFVSAVVAGGAVLSGSGYRVQSGAGFQQQSASYLYSPVDGEWLMGNSSLTAFTLLSFGPGHTPSTRYLSTNWPALRVKDPTNNITLAFMAGTNTSQYINYQGIATPPIKAGFSTNYTMTGKTEAMLFCTGTNQIITLPNATNSPGIMLSIRVASTTGSVIVTNATGAQTVFGTLSVSVGATNVLNVASDGSNWW